MTTPVNTCSPSYDANTPIQTVSQINTKTTTTPLAENIPERTGKIDHLDAKPVDPEQNEALNSVK